MSVAPMLPSVPLSPLDLETVARHAFCRQVGLHAVARAPTWRQIMFGGLPVRFHVPEPPDAVLAAIDRAPDPAQTPVRAAANKLQTDLSRSRPRGSQPQSVTGRRPLPPARADLAEWYRRLFLVATGPDGLRLLAAAGYLTPRDIAVADGAFPQGLSHERMQAVEAAVALTAAAGRAHHDAELPPWLNSQLLTLMDDHSPAEFFQGLYQKQPPAPKGGSPSAQPSKLVEQTAPNPSPGDT